MDESHGPKRFASDPNFRIDLLDSDVPPPLVEQMREAHFGPRQVETLVPCPTCEHCATCRGMHVVSAAVRSEIRRPKGEDPTL